MTRCRCCGHYLEDCQGGLPAAREGYCGPCLASKAEAGEVVTALDVPNCNEWANRRGMGSLEGPPRTH
jgi:hypothetical protein